MAVNMCYYLKKKRINDPKGDSEVSSNVTATIVPDGTDPRGQGCVLLGFQRARLLPPTASETKLPPKAAGARLLPKAMEGMLLPQRAEHKAKEDYSFFLF